MKFKRFRLVTLLVAVTVIAIILAAVIEQRSIIGQSSTTSPNGDWSLHLRLTKKSTLFTSHQVLDAEIRHRENANWNVKTSIPRDDADAVTISDQNPDYPIVWSEDSTTVNYWINDQLEDVIRIEVDDQYHTFERKLNSTTVKVPADL